jgi:membrane protein YqaA with SNARE-associated domain
MRTFSQWIIALFASPLGVVVLAALDSTIFFSLPFGIDGAVIVLAARLRELWWTVALLATAGSVGGAALTFWMGATIGDHGLDRWVEPKRLEKMRRRIRERGAIMLAVLDLIPPPFPFTPFVLAAGALDVSARTFFITLIICRLFRFGGEAALARVYGRNILSWLESDLSYTIVSALTFMAIALTTVSVIQIVRTSGRRSARRARA